MFIEPNTYWEVETKIYNKLHYLLDELYQPNVYTENNKDHSNN